MLSEHPKPRRDASKNNALNFVHMTTARRFFELFHFWVYSPLKILIAWINRMDLNFVILNLDECRVVGVILHLFIQRRVHF